METLILAIHIITSVALVLFILLQSGKGGGVSAAFGGGAGAALGQRSAATVLGKLTVVLSIIFGITSMSLAIMSTNDPTAADAADVAAPVSEEPATKTKQEAAEGGTPASSEAGSDTSTTSAEETPAKTQPPAVPSGSDTTESVSPTDTTPKTTPSEDAPQ